MSCKDQTDLLKVPPPDLGHTRELGIGLPMPASEAPNPRESIPRASVGDVVGRAVVDGAVNETGFVADVDVVTTAVGTTVAAATEVLLMS